MSALLGRGQALLALDRDAEAVAAFEAALAVDPSLTDIRAPRRSAEVPQRGAGPRQRAREAARAGRLDEAIAGLHGGDRELARQRLPVSRAGRRRAAEGRHADGSALEHFRKATALEPTDARSLAQIGEILERAATSKARPRRTRESLAHRAERRSAEARSTRVRARLALARLPAEYRAIDQAPQITRADLAALIGVRLGTLLPAGAARTPALITDVRSNWAATWIMAVARAGVMEPFANHAFQPRTVVRRTDLAQAVGAAARACRRAASGHGPRRGRRRG